MAERPGLAHIDESIGRHQRPAECMTQERSKRRDAVLQKGSGTARRCRECWPSFAIWVDGAQSLSQCFDGFDVTSYSILTVGDIMVYSIDWIVTG